MAVLRSTLTRGREAQAGEFLEKIDSGDRIALDIKETPLFGAISYTGNVPFWQLDLSALATPDMHDPAAEPLLVATLDRTRFKLSRRREPMPYTWRSTAHEELHFVHQGNARFITELGEIAAIPGRFIHLGQGVRYRVVPESDTFFDLIIESQAPLRGGEHWPLVGLTPLLPRFPLSAADTSSRETWEERIYGLDWRANVTRAYDPLIVKEVVGDHQLAYAVDMADIPADVPHTHRPLRLFTSDVLELDISKQGDGEGPPFYHRNNVRNEIHFVHSGDANQLTELGPIVAPAGTIYCMPFGIEHTFGKRDITPQTLLFESKGPIELAPGLPR